MATDALALPLRESLIRFCACPLSTSPRAPDSPAATPRALWVWWRLRPARMPARGARVRRSRPSTKGAALRRRRHRATECPARSQPWPWARFGCPVAMGSLWVSWAKGAGLPAVQGASATLKMAIGAYGGSWGSIGQPWQWLYRASLHDAPSGPGRGSWSCDASAILRRTR